VASRRQVSVILIGRTLTLVRIKLEKIDADQAKTYINIYE
jgi:hypothetical protein